MKSLGLITMYVIMVLILDFSLFQLAIKCDMTCIKCPQKHLKFLASKANITKNYLKLSFLFVNLTQTLIFENRWRLKKNF